MKLNWKQNIAREFLIVIVCIIMSIIAFFITYPYNYFINSKVDNLNEEIEIVKNQIDVIQKPIEEKISEQKWMYGEWKKNDNLGGYNNYLEHWERLEYLHDKDSIPYKWQNRWDKIVIEHLKNMNFINATELDEYISRNSINRKDKIEIEKSKKLEDKVLSLRKDFREKKGDILYFNDQMDFALNTLYIIALIAFPFRYIIYGIKWSLKTLKQEIIE